MSTFDEQVREAEARINADNRNDGWPEVEYDLSNVDVDYANHDGGATLFHVWVSRKYRDGAQ